MGVVQSINGCEIQQDNGVNADCIETLESLLGMARAGDVVGVAFAAQHADGSTTGNIGGFVRQSRIVGELMFCISRLTQ